MTFNRIHFGRTHARLPFVAILILMFLFSSCVEDIDFSGLNNIFSTPYKWSTIYSGPFINKAPSFNMDSIRYDSLSIYKVTCGIRFDSAVALTGIVLNYWETGKEFEEIKVKQVIADTLDFSSQDAYFYNIRITNLEPDSEYQICGWATYLTGTDTTIMQAACKHFLTE